MKRIAALVAPAFIIVLLAGCPPKSQPPPAAPATTGSQATTTEPPTQYRIAVVPKGVTHSFWKTVKAGAKAACDEAGAEMLWKGPAQETDVAGQMAIIENFITSGVDALVMAACDADAMVPKVKQALEAGIPVITIDSGISSEDALSFVATDNVAGAAEAGEKLAELIGGKGQVGIIPFIKGAATSDMREQGFTDAIKTHPGITLVPPLYSQSDAEKGMKAAENMLTRYPDLKGIFAANEPGAIGAAQAIKQRGATGQVHLVAFDAADAEIEALKEGVIDALIVQDPYRMGYDGVKAAIDAIEGRPVEKRIDTGVYVVTMENFEDPDIQKVLFPDIEG